MNALRPSVYLETTFVSYLTASPGRDLICAAHQAITREWWERRRTEFDCYVSTVVEDEASRGNPDAAGRRLASMKGIPRLTVTEHATELAEALISHRIIPKNKPEDALHIAVSAVHGMDYLLTWNCGHLANAELKESTESLAAVYGYGIPVICTPEELMGDLM